MMRALSLSICALLVIAPLSASAETATGMTAMQYYAGTWNCMGGPAGTPPMPATLVAAYETGNGVMRQTLDVPATATFPGVKSTTLVSWEAKNNMFVSVALDDRGGWNVSRAPAFTGNKELWADVATDDGKIGRSEIDRVDQNDYIYTAYATPTITAPRLRATCKRAT